MRDGGAARNVLYGACRVAALTLDEIFLGMMLFFSIIFGTVALSKAPNDLLSIATYLATAGGVAGVAAAFFTVPVWIVIKVTG